MTAARALARSGLVLFVPIILWPSTAVAQDCQHAPAGFSVAEPSPGVLLFQWAAPNCRIVAYELQVGRTRGTSDLAVFVLLAPATSVQIGRVPVGQYFFRLVAIASVSLQRSPPTADLAVIVGGGCGLADPPASAAGIAIDRGGHQTIEVRWSPPPTGCQPESYLIEIAAEAAFLSRVSFPVSAVPDPQRGLFFRRDGLPIRVYFARISSITRTGASEPTGALELNIARPSAPEPPINFRARLLPGGMVVFEWALVANALVPTDGYLLEAGLQSGAVDATLPFLAPGASITIGPFPRGVTFYLRVRARFGEQTSGPSNEVAVFVP